MPLQATRLFGFLLVLHLVSFASGCGGGGASGGIQCVLPVSIDVVGGDRMNPDEAGHPLPTQIRIVQLSSLAKLDSAEFGQIWQQTDETLGADLVTAQEATAFPGRTERVPVDLDPRTRFVLGVAIVRSPSGTSWRSVVPLPSAADRCERYEPRGAPSPAITFRVDDSRIASSSQLGAVTEANR